MSHFLVRDLAVEERNRMEVWAEAMRTLNKADENTDFESRCSRLLMRIIVSLLSSLDDQNKAQTFTKSGD